MFMHVVRTDFGYCIVYWITHSFILIISGHNHKNSSKKKRKKKRKILMNQCGRNKKYDYNLITNLEIVAAGRSLTAVVFLPVGGRETRSFISQLSN